MIIDFTTGELIADGRKARWLWLPWLFWTELIRFFNVYIITQKEGIK